MPTHHPAPKAVAHSAVMGPAEYAERQAQGKLFDVHQ